MLLPGLLAFAFAFESGGFFARTIAVGVVVLCVLLAVSLLAVRRPAMGFGLAAVVTTLALVLFAGWTFLSESWSEAPGRALFEFDRSLLYVLAFAIMAVLARTVADVRWVVRGLLLALFLVAGAALVSRIMPDVWSTGESVANDRLSYPLTYWNALGVMSAAGFLLAFAVTSDLREAPWVRIAAAAALPVFAATILFTFSRAATLLGLVLLVVFVLLARSRGALSGLLVLPAAAVALAAAYNADALASDRPTTPVAIDQGHDVAFVVVICMIGAAIARYSLLRLDDQRFEIRMPEAMTRRRVRWGTAAGLVVAVVALALAAGAAGELDEQYDRFVRGDQVEVGETGQADFRERFANPGNNGRREQWAAAVDGFREDRAKGLGAGTYPLTWNRFRDNEFQVEDAHSLYVEVLSELGIVGLLLIAVAIATILLALLRRVRGPDRVLYAGLFTVTLLWALHAGVDWDWEMPAVTAPVIAAAGAALAAGARGPSLRVPLPVRGVLAVVCLLLAITPVRVWQSELDSQDAKRELARNDCPAAAKHARDSIDTLSVTPEPHEIVGYCHLREGRSQPAVASFRTAVSKDPDNWRVHYGLSLALAIDGQDPLPEMRIARELNPLEPLSNEMGKKLYEAKRPETRRRRALGARLPKD